MNLGNGQIRIKKCLLIQKFQFLMDAVKYFPSHDLLLTVKYIPLALLTLGFSSIKHNFSPNL